MRKKRSFKEIFLLYETLNEIKIYQIKEVEHEKDEKTVGMIEIL